MKSLVKRAATRCGWLSIVGAAAASMLLGTSALAAADTTRVIVAFKPGSAAAVRGAVSAARGSVQLEIFGMDAMAVEVPTQALNGLARNPNVEYVEEDVKRYPLAGTTPSTGTPYASGQLVPYGIKLVQADQLSDSLAGNRKVCIIDSGYSRGHEDLDDSTNLTGEYDTGTGWWYTDENHHGTHVAGTIAALNSAVWSGGSFVYVPPGVHVDIPLQAYFRINTENMGQFERTLIIADEGSSVHYVEGCTAPTYSSDSLHSAVVEIIVMKDAHVRYTTIQNWSNNVYNLVTKRTAVHEGGRMEWIDGNIGSKVTMKYPACYLLGERASGETLSVAFAGEGQHQDAGAKMVHAAPRTTSNIVSKSVARNGGRTSYRGLVQVQEGATGSKSNVVCDALLVDTISRSDTYPYVDVREDDVSLGHEATVSKVGDDQLFYLMSRGLTETEAMAMVVRGFVEPIARELPMEYALELNRLIELQMEGSVG